jgi:hypothetical protein
MHRKQEKQSEDRDNGHVHIVVFTQIAQISIELFDAFLVRLDAFSSESFVELDAC